jgi:hypothetical protein
MRSLGLTVTAITAVHTNTFCGLGRHSIMMIDEVVYLQALVRESLSMRVKR